jgi:hypothetical protein
MFFFFFVWMVSEEMEIEENGITRILKSDMVVSSSCVLSLGKKIQPAVWMGLLGLVVIEMSYIVTRKSQSILPPGCG